MQDSHTAASAAETTPEAGPLRLVPTATRGLPEWLAGRVDEHLAIFAAQMTQGLLAASTAVGLEVMGELMDVEVVELVGPKGKHDPARVAMRHGSQPGTVTLGGRRVGVRRPRVRTTGPGAHELALESYTTLASTDLLAEGIVARMLAGLSTRRYPAGLEPVGSQVEQAARGTSKSSVSRRFVAATAERLAQLLARRWTSSASWWCSWTASGWASTCWSARWASPPTAPRSPWGWPRAPPRTPRCAPAWSPIWPTGAWTPGVGCCSSSTAARRSTRRSAPCSAPRRWSSGVVGTRNPGVTEHLPEAERPLVQRRLRAAWALADADQATAELEQLAAALTASGPAPPPPCARAWPRP